MSCSAVPLFQDFHVFTLLEALQTRGSILYGDNWLDHCPLVIHLFQPFYPPLKSGRAWGGTEEFPMLYKVGTPSNQSPLLGVF